MKDLANSSQGLAAPILEQYISNAQSTVDPEAEHSQAKTLAEIHPSHQGGQGEIQPNRFPTAPYGQYEFPSQSQGYQIYPPRYSSTGTSFIDLGQTYPDASSQLYPPLPQYSSQPLSISQTSQFPTPPTSAGQSQYGSPPNTMTTYPARIVDQVNMHIPQTRKKEIKKHHCPTCPKSFLRPSSLEAHNRTHTGEKPFNCRLLGCHRGVGGEGFNVKSNCVRHEKSHDEKGQAPPLQPRAAQPRP